MVYVITGGPGFGKTTIINLIEREGFPICMEGARALISSQENQTGSVNFPLIPVNFERDIALQRINFLQSTKPNTIAFSDRGLPDQIAYSWYKGKLPSDFIKEAVLSNRYASFVFVAPPWEIIFKMDDIRKESFDEACAIHRQIIRAYQEYGYKIIDLPIETPEYRVKFIKNFLGI